MLMVANPIIGSFWACQFTLSITSVVILRIPAADVTTVLNCFISAVCWSRTSLFSSTVVHAAVLATSPGYVGSTKWWTVSQNYRASLSSNSDNLCCPPPKILGIAAKLLVHFSRRVVRSSNVSFPLMGVHDLFRNKSATAASLVMVVFGHVADVTAVNC